MAKIADILVTERNRQAPTEWNKIHIYLGILSHTASRHIAIDLGLASKPLAA